MKLIRKYQTGNPMAFSSYFSGSNSDRREAIDEGSKKLASAFNTFMGWLGKALTSPISGMAVPAGTASGAWSYSLSPHYTKNVTTLQPAAKKVIEENAAYISPSSHIAAWTLGSWNPKVGAQVLASDPRLQSLGIVGDLVTLKYGPKVIKGTSKAAVNTAAKAGNETARATIIAREINLATKNKPNLSNRTISVKRSNNAVTELPDLVYTLYNEFGEPIGQTNVGGAVFGSGNKAHRMVDGVMSMRNAHKVSEDTYNAAIQDIIDNGGKGLESGWSLMMPLKTLAVTSKFPHTVIGLEFGNPVRLLTGTSNRAVPQRVSGNHFLEIKPSTEIRYNEITGNFELVPIVNSEPYVPTSLKFFERQPSKISVAERIGIPKGERNNINNSGNLERTVNDIILENGYSLPEETGMFAQKHSSVGSSYRKTFEELWGKENVDRLTDDLLGKLILIRNKLVDANIPLKGDFVYVVDGQAKAYRNGLEIGYLSNSYIDNGKALHPEMVKKQGINNAGVSELLYNGTILAENRPIISGSRLLMPEVTTHIWSKYPTRKLISTEGVHAWPLRTAQERGIKLNYEKNWHTLPEFSKLHQLALDENIRTNLIGLPIYELSEPSYLPMVKNARVFDISLLRDGYINLDFTPGFAYKQGGKMNTLQFLKKGSGIHIKKENRGKFTDYCGGKVTSACIAKGKASSDPAIRKRATFAANARKWKHKKGGIILKFQLGGPGYFTSLKDPEYINSSDVRSGLDPNYRSYAYSINKYNKFDPSIEDPDLRAEKGITEAYDSAKSSLRDWYLSDEYKLRLDRARSNTWIPNIMLSSNLDIVNNLIGRLNSASLGFDNGEHRDDVLYNAVTDYNNNKIYFNKDLYKYAKSFPGNIFGTSTHELSHWTDVVLPQFVLDNNHKLIKLKPNLSKEIMLNYGRDTEVRARAEDIIMNYNLSTGYKSLNDFVDKNKDKIPALKLLINIFDSEESVLNYLNNFAGKSKDMTYYVKRGGKAFVKGVNVLDSNPDAYKHVKKKYKMRSALQGGNTASWMSTAANIGSNLLSVVRENLKITADINSKIAQNEIDFSKALEQVVELNMKNTSEKYLKWIKDYQSGLTLDNPSLIVALHQGWEELNLKITKLKNDLKNKNGLLLAEADALKLENTTNALVNGALNIMSMLASKWGSGYTPKFNTSNNSFTNTSGYSAATVTLPVSSPTFNYKPVV